jgi:hypothetical protein
MSQANQPQSSQSEVHPLTRIANLEKKVAQLERRIAELESAKAPLSSLFSTTPASVPDKSPDDKFFEIVSIDTKVIEANDSWTKVAWKLVVQSLSNAPLAFHASIEFLDGDGFIVDDTPASNLILPAKNQETYTGYTLIDAALMQNISSIRAQLQLA